MRRLVTLWVGNSIGAVERACLRSMLRQGHHVALYSYGVPEGVPAGVAVLDATQVLPESSVFRNIGGSVALFSDWFRYELMRRGEGTWVDTDLYCLRPIDFDRANLFGEQAPGVLNNAVLRLPPDSPLLPPLLTVFERRSVPDWIPMRRKLTARVRRLLDGPDSLSRLPWGSTGPHALTALAKRYGLLSQALPRDIFYPVAWRDAQWIADPGIALDDVVNERTVAVHLWNECIRTFKDQPAAQGSFLHRLQQEGR